LKAHILFVGFGRLHQLKIEFNQQERASKVQFANFVRFCAVFEHGGINYEEIKDEKE
jgi:hypothetical protein